MNASLKEQIIHVIVDPLCTFTLVFFYLASDSMKQIEWVPKGQVKEPGAYGIPIFVKPAS